MVTDNNDDCQSTAVLILSFQLEIPEKQQLSLGALRTHYVKLPLSFS
jgi:hypothetical protein